MTNEPAPRPPAPTETERIDLRPIMRALWRRAWVIVLCAGLAGAAALAYSLSRDKEYEATAQVFFRDPGLAQGLVGPQLPRYPAEVVQTVATNTALTQLDEVATRTADDLGTLDAGQVTHQIEVDQSSISNVYDITASAGDPAAAASLANTYARQAIAVKREIDRRTVTEALQKMSADFTKLQDQIANSPDGPSAEDSARLQSLEDGIRGLTIFRGLQSGNVTLVQPAVAPTSAASPKPLTDTAYGLLLGAVLGIALALLLARLDRRVTDAETAERAYGLPVLSVVGEDGGTDQLLRDLLARLRYASAGGGLRSLGVAPATAEDRSAALSRRIAATAAAAGARTALIDTTGTSAPGAGYDVIGPDEAAGGAAGFLDGEAFRSVLADAEGRYDLVVVDSAPVGEAPAALPLLSNVAANIAVGRLGHTLKAQAEELARRLTALGPPVLGVVLLDAEAEGHAEPTREAEGTDLPAAERSVPAS